MLSEDLLAIADAIEGDRRMRTLCALLRACAEDAAELEHLAMPERSQPQPDSPQPNLPQPDLNDPKIVRLFRFRGKP